MNKIREIKMKLKEFMTLKVYLSYMGFSAIAFAFAGEIVSASFLMMFTLLGLIVLEEKKRTLQI